MYKVLNNIRTMFSFCSLVQAGYPVEQIYLLTYELSVIRRARN